MLLCKILYKYITVTCEHTYTLKITINLPETWFSKSLHFLKTANKTLKSTYTCFSLCIYIFTHLEKSFETLHIQKSHAKVQKYAIKLPLTKQLSHEICCRKCNQVQTPIWYHTRTYMCTYISLQHVTKATHQNYISYKIDLPTNFTYQCGYLPV